MGLLLEILDDEDGVEDVVPDLAGHAKAEVKVLVVMCQMILLHVSEMGRQARVMHASEGISISWGIETTNLRIMHAVVQHICRDMSQLGVSL